MTYEAMGLFASGESPAAVARGETTIGGRIPINTPEAGSRSAIRLRQRRCSRFRRSVSSSRRTRVRQVEGAAIGLVQAEHGVMNGSAVAVLEV